jgi:hypothetical protein
MRSLNVQLFVQAVNSSIFPLNSTRCPSCPAAKLFVDWYLRIHKAVHFFKAILSLKKVVVFISAEGAATTNNANEIWND